MDIITGGGHKKAIKSNISDAAFGGGFFNREFREVPGEELRFMWWNRRHDFAQGINLFWHQARQHPGDHLRRLYCPPQWAGVDMLDREFNQRLGGEPGLFVAKFGQTATQLIGKSMVLLVLSMPDKIENAFTHALFFLDAVVLRSIRSTLPIYKNRRNKLRGSRSCEQ